MRRSDNLPDCNCTDTLPFQCQIFNLPAKDLLRFLFKTTRNVFTIKLNLNLNYQL